MAWNYIGHIACIGLWEVGFPREDIQKKSEFVFFMAIAHNFCAHTFKSETISFHYFSQSISKIEKVWTLDFRKWGQKDI